MVRIDENTIKLCCGGKGCPIIQDIGDGNVTITDDNGNVITVKKEEAGMISPALEHLTPKAPINSNEELLLG